MTDQPKLTDAAETIAAIMSPPEPKVYPTDETLELELSPAAWNFIRSALADKAMRASQDAMQVANAPTSLLNPSIEGDMLLVDVYQTIGTQADYLQMRISELLGEDQISAVAVPWPAEIQGQRRNRVDGPAEHGRPGSARKPNKA